MTTPLGNFSENSSVLVGVYFPNCLIRNATQCIMYPILVHATYSNQSINITGTHCIISSNIHIFQIYINMLYFDNFPGTHCIISSATPHSGRSLLPTSPGYGGIGTP